ncbi:MAG: hypothetical protein HC886_01600 [Leptolyngbyaceae cyanobacterium SM1_1_3]|nr:hypothetical protein [Leptolyngbyaceae cyanobacterium SM1_1_3]NJN03288.1 hypothetical protein [Leptolyngbyaceae cyanobacterium RM1_1_2]
MSSSCILTGGQFTITPYTANEVSSGLAVLEAVTAGTVECGHTISIPLNSF